MNLTKIDHKYEIVGHNGDLAFLDSIRLAEMRRVIQIHFRQIENNAAFPRARDFYHVNAHVTFNDPASLFVNPGSIVSEFLGSGYGSTREAAASHAASEALERALARGGGTRSSRPVITHCFSLVNGKDIHVAGDLTKEIWQDGINPFFSRSGEAFHPVSSQALRCAVCETVEREVVDGFIEGRYNYCCDVTGLACADNFTKAGICDLRNDGYDVRILSILNPWKVFVHIAVARSSYSRDFRCAFSGSGADFSPEYASKQAFMELARYAYLGQTVACKNSTEARFRRDGNEVIPCLRSVLHLALPEGMQNIACFFNKDRYVNEEFQQPHFQPSDLLDSLRETGRDLWIVTLHDNRDLIPGFSVKSIVPGFSTNYGVVRDFIP